MYKFSYLFKLQTSDTIVSNNRIDCFYKCSSSSLHEFYSDLDMVVFAAHFPFHAIKIGFQK